jgi:hypothetical protein
MLPPPAEWVAPAAEVIEIAEVVAAPAPPTPAAPPPAITPRQPLPTYAPAPNWAPPPMPLVMPPPIAMAPPVFHAPPPKAGIARRRSTGSKKLRPVAWAFGIFAILSVIGAIDSAVNKSSSNNFNVTVPTIQFTVPSFVQSHAPAPAIPVNVMPNLVTLGAADEIYRVDHGSYTNSVSALNKLQFHVDPKGDYEIGVNATAGYCIVGRESADVWRLYDKNDPANIVSSYASKAAAMHACSFPVHWG